MGFFSKLFTGGDEFAGANNAHLAEILQKDLSQLDKRRVAKKTIEMGLQASGTMKSADRFIEFFNNSERVNQLNALALALRVLNIPSNLRGEDWMPVNNPFLPIDGMSLKISAARLNAKLKLNVGVSSERIDLRDWLV